MRIRDWSSDVCSSDLSRQGTRRASVSGVGRLFDRRYRDLSMDRTLPVAWVGMGGRSQRQAMVRCRRRAPRSEEHTSELQSLMRISYAVFCLKKKKYTNKQYILIHVNTTYIVTT